MKNQNIKQLIELKNDYYDEVNFSSHNISEETVRSGYLNKVLEIFGWNLSKTSEVIQEKKLSGNIKKRLSSIGSTHTKPDYRLLDRGVLRMYLDAKTAPEDFRQSRDVAFQIRSYGWSSQIDLSMVSNFEHFVIYDTTFKPSIDMDAHYRSFHFTIDDFIENYDLYFQFFDKSIIQKRAWNLEPFHIELHSGDSKSLDTDFLDLISTFRIKLGDGIYKDNSALSIRKIQYFIQVIINRILFIRILEAIEMEPENKLKSWLENGKGFWEQFHQSSKNEFYLKYDGALFEEIIFDSINITDVYFEDFINSLYGTSPYKFDVIEPSLIAEIYDIFLGEELVLTDGKIKISYKKLSPAGSVPTPSELSAYISNKVLNLQSYYEVEDILKKVKVLDPCAGSGSFLVVAYDCIVNRIQEIQGDHEITYALLKSVVKNCIYGVDLDPIAIEVLKMTISLKLIMSHYEPVEPIENMLSDFGRNFQLGNSIVGKDIYELKNDLYFETEEIDQIATDYSEIFPEIMLKGGFTYILTNPPYIEPKHFKKNWPITFEYLKNKFVSDTGKSDVSLFFLEKVFDLVSKKGKIGLVIQRRFFNTNYGKKIREWLAENGFLLEIKEYQATNIFKNKTTYIAVIIAEKKNNKYVDYFVSLDDVNGNRNNLIEVLEATDDKLKISTEILLNAPKWSYRYFRAAEILNTLKQEEFFTINSSSRFKVTVGPQVLDKKYYVLYSATKINHNLISGYNREGELITIEYGIVRPLYENEKMNSFTNFDTEPISTYLIFPYSNEGILLTLDELQENFPLALKYFRSVRTKTKVALRPNPNEFYGYTRQQNLSLGNKPKIFVPMTSKRVIASVSEINMFGDNSNINAIVDAEDDVDTLQAYCVVLNSELFSLLTIPVSGDARGGYYKMNKQYIGEIPLPRLTNNEVQKLVNIYKEIQLTLHFYVNAYGEEIKAIAKKIKNLQAKQNQFAYMKYNISESDIKLLKANVDLESIDWFGKFIQG